MNRMKYLYFMSTFCQAICDGKYVFVIRSGFVKTQHSPYGSAARKLFVKHKQVTIINHGDEELIKIFVKGAASWKRKTYRTPDFIIGRFDDRSTELSTNIAKDFEPDKTMPPPSGWRMPVQMNGREEFMLE
jgi:hypothetical protein